MHSSITPGLLILHGNQMEQLRAAVFQWLHNHPLGPLEPETFLVQSNGVAEWLKIALAEEMRVCAATRVALPARFLWETYRGMLGRERVPRRSAVDKGPLTWRLMRLLPTLLADPVFAPLRHFLADGEAERRLQLAERLADLFDQYQVYRADWLDDWAGGRDQLRCARGDIIALPPEQRWQGQVWRAVIDDVEPHERALGRATVHTEFVRASAAGELPLGRLPRRIVIFGVSALPYQTLEALATPRWCWPCPTRAATTGATSSRAATCCAPRTVVSSCATARTWARCRSKSCTPTAIRCWPAGGARAATSSACSTNSTKRRPMPQPLPAMTTR